MRRADTTHADEVRRHDHLIALIARRPAIRKLQHAIDSIAEVWSPPDHMHACLGGRVHWRVQPSVDAVRIVAAHHADSRIAIRRAVIVALSVAAPHGHLCCREIELALAAEDPVVRIHAARAAAWHALGHQLRDPLTACLQDRVWTVRWNAARALASTERHALALVALRDSQPRPGTRGVDEWQKCAREADRGYGGLIQSEHAP